MLTIIVALLVNLFIETSESFTVVVPRDQIVAHVGSTVTLPCWISPPENAEVLEIRWYRNDQFSNPVLLYQHGKIIQEESFRNRTSLTLRSDLSGGLKDGDVSLRLEKLRIQDEGSFHCYVSGENEYDSGEVFLKVTALGSAPVLFPQPLDDGRVNISCKSSGWYPEPDVSWMSDERTVLRPGGVSRSRGADEMFSVHSWTAVSHSDAQLLSCSMSLKTGESREGRLNIKAIISSGSSVPWTLFFIALFFALGLAGLILYKYRHKLTVFISGKKTVKEVCDDETMESLTKEVCEDESMERGTKAVKDRNTEEQKKYTEKLKADASVGETSGASPSPNYEGSSSSCGEAATLLQAVVHSQPSESVGDTNIEELRKHAVQITIDPEHLHPGLMVTKNHKIVREAAEYKHTREGFPYELCAFGAQTFTSGRHYWEVDLAREDTPPKNYWLIGVAEHGNFRVKDRSALTPSNGYWFLCSDGPNGFYTNSDPPVSLPLTPRPEQLGVLLDYDRGQLSFYSVKERKHVLTMSTRFIGSVTPLFNPGVEDKTPLTILDCPEPVEPPVESSE
ncbi:butyrophilin subfamily 1 member A1-like isoform X2 [Siphateles boraxobius]|uniref:butyrophilin subfamily 1 member A1-like isoform X2 n=1 Tax=Siphateles boraxobius TaxID=180520 RepID=UPI00406414C5